MRKPGESITITRVAYQLVMQNMKLIHQHSPGMNQNQD
jgi:hypothetical protein